MENRKYRGSLNLGHYYQAPNLNRHSVQIQKITKPSRIIKDNGIATYISQFNHDNDYEEMDYDGINPFGTTKQGTSKKLKSYRQFIPKEHIPKIAKSKMMQDQQQTEYIIIPARVKKPHYILEYSGEEEEPQFTQNIPLNKKVNIISTQRIQKNMGKNKTVSIPKEIDFQGFEKSIKERFEDIESIMQSENKNLKEHNQYLIAVIKKMQTVDKEQKSLIKNQSNIIEKLKQERNAYMERCFQLQNMLENSYERGKYSNGLTFDQNPQLALSTRTASEFNQTANKAQRKNQRQELITKKQRQQKLGDLRQHLKETIQQSPERNYTPAMRTQNPRKNFNNIKENEQDSQYHNQLHHYIDPTPKFFSKNQSPQQKSNLAPKISHNINNSNLNSILFNDESSGIMHNSNSFADAGGWVNTNSGLSVVRTLSHHLIETQEKNKKNLQTQEAESEEDDDGIQGDDQDTENQSLNEKENEGTQQKAIEELNRKFEQLIKQYRINHDVSLRKQCVHLAKRIKILKQDIENKKDRYK